jgi:hypothetical protein
MSLEHVWPEWLLRLMADRLTTTETLVTRDGKTAKRDSMETTVKRVCESCNEGWMSDLETKAKPLLTPMIMGDGLPLIRTPDEMRILATWALKTHLMIDFYFPPHQRFIPRRLYSEFFRRQTPPQQCAVWIAAYDVEKPTFAVKATQAFDTVPTTYTPEGIVVTGRAGPVGVMCTFAMYHLIFQIILIDVGGRFAGLGTLGATQLIWPLPKSQIEWPIRMEALDEASFEVFANRPIDLLFPR